MGRGGTLRRGRGNNCDDAIERTTFVVFEHCCFCIFVLSSFGQNPMCDAKTWHINGTYDNLVLYFFYLSWIFVNHILTVHIRRNECVQTGQVI